MIKYLTYRIFVISIIILLYSTCFAQSYNTQVVNQYYKQNFDELQRTINGQILFTPMTSFKTYLIDSTGIVNHTWSSNYFPGQSVYWLGNGTILRTIKVNVQGLGGMGGGIQKMLWDGTIVWDFRYCTDEFQSHHDIEPLPNGNVLMIAWENKTRAEAINAGRNPNTPIGEVVYPDHIIEVKPTGLTTGDIVWKWHFWDHLIQDYDPSKENYGVIADHPELIDINYVSSSGLDWTHINSIDYNEKFDQILLSVRNYNEIWVIDHSTTTEEAAGHSGGKSGKGGDILYRWGNPATYKAGTSNDQKFFCQHDAQWINEGYLGEGNILVFNNGVDRPEGRFSSIDEFIPPVNENGEYFLEPGSAYEPIEQTWFYIANPAGSFYSRMISGAERLPNGNTLICNGEQGKFFEVTPLGSTVWTYTNSYPSILSNNVFKIVYIPPTEDIPNQPPNKPTIIGETNGAIQKSYNYTIQTTDPDQDDVQYLIDWGDNNKTLNGFNQSGKKITISHIWDTKGIYNIKVKAIDYRYAESDWATLEVNMPKTHIYNPIIQKILKIFGLFPIFEKILN